MFNRRQQSEIKKELNSPILSWRHSFRFPLYQLPTRIFSMKGNWEDWISEDSSVWNSIASTRTIWERPGPLFTHRTKLSTRFLGPKDRKLRRDTNKKMCAKCMPTSRMLPAAQLWQKKSMLLLHAIQGEKIVVSALLSNILWYIC